LVTVGSTYRLSGGDTIDVGYGHEFVEDSVVRDSVAGVPGVLAGRFKDTADVLSVQYNRKL
jgi:long-subunit fatty acid transport protein